MKPPHGSSVERLIRELDDIRVTEAVLEATGDDLLDRARDVAEATQERVRQLQDGRSGYPGPNPD